MYITPNKAKDVKLTLAETKALNRILLGGPSTLHEKGHKTALKTIESIRRKGLIGDHLLLTAKGRDAVVDFDHTTPL